ncbi:MAG: alpha/beta hydrolase [Planctomycetes bacterium]|nr:alpha/beta hydrolase [Planctomycetota bacterium]
MQLARAILPLLVLLSCAHALPARAQERETSAPEQMKPDAGVTWRRGIVYARRGERELALDFARPANTAHALPCLIAIHGGGWRNGQREDLHPVVERWARAGFAAATISYRLLPEHRFPAAWEDARDAHAFLVAHAGELGIDAERFTALGFSAGAHLALLLGTREEREPGRPRVRSVANFFGPTNLGATDLSARAQGIVAEFLGRSAADDPALANAASPLAWVTPGDAEARSFHGTADPLVPYSQAEVLHAALRAAGVPEQLYARDGAGHGWAREQLEADLDLLIAHGQSCLRGATTLPLAWSEDFGGELSGWWLSDPAAWRVTGENELRALEIIAKQSSYAPRHRSPLHLAVRTELAVESFVLDVDLRSTHPSYGHRDLVLVCGWQDAEHYYYVHLGQQADATSHGVFVVDGAARRRLDGERGAGTPWGERWHRARLVRDVTSGSIELYFDDLRTPHLRAVDRSFLRGSIGVGSFDDTGRFDALRLYAAPSATK